MSDTTRYESAESLRAAARYWEEKDRDSVKMERGRLQAMLEAYL